MWRRGQHRPLRVLEYTEHEPYEEPHEPPWDGVIPYPSPPEGAWDPSDEAVVWVNGRRVQLREGDLIYLRWNQFVPSSCIAAFNEGISHVGIVLRVDGHQFAFVDSCLYPPDLPYSNFVPNDRGERLRNGLHAQLLQHSFDGARHMWVHRPEPFSRAQLRAMRTLVRQRMNAHTADLRDHDYEAHWYSPEFLWACFNWKPYSKKRWMCSESIGHILQAAGRWPWSPSTKMSDLRRRVRGSVYQVF